MTYDGRGRMTSRTDPDLGSLQYNYDGLDELVQQTDAKLNTVKFEYDVLGRVTKRTESDLISQWTYDTAANGIGKPAQLTASNGFQRTYQYDGYGRPTSLTNLIGSSFTTSVAYDSAGRLASLTYPTGVSLGYGYQNGYLTEVRRTDAGNQLLWQLQSLDASGRVRQARLGNGMVVSRSYDAVSDRLGAIVSGLNGGNEVQNESYGFDDSGNLSWRKDGNRSLIETFGYDELDRLTSAQVMGAVNKTYSFAYDDIGNLTSKTDIGNYSYPTAGSRYPHAPTSIGSMSGSFSYDANGNLLSGAGRTYTWTSYNMPLHVTRGTNASDFWYDGEHNRVKQVASDGTTTIYLNPRIDLGAHFEQVSNGGQTFNRHTIYAGSEVVGQIVTGSQNATRYFHHDYLGSVVAVSDASGSVVERYSYDSWGKRRNLDGSDDVAGGLKSTAVDRGYTEHEELDNLGLVHMNARLYDPAVGQFVSADTMVPHPDSTQGFNRYAYVNNNPLVFTDPSGHEDRYDLTYWRDGPSHGIAYNTGPNGSGVYQIVCTNCLRGSDLGGLYSSPGTGGGSLQSWLDQGHGYGYSQIGFNTGSNLSIVRNGGFTGGVSTIIYTNTTPVAQSSTGGSTGSSAPPPRQFAPVEGAYKPGSIQLTAVAGSIAKNLLPGVDFAHNGWLAAKEGDYAMAGVYGIGAISDVFLFAVTGGQEKLVESALKEAVEYTVEHGANYIAKEAGEHAATNLAAKEGVVYLRKDIITGGEYVGQAESEARYLVRQSEHARANPNADFEFHILERARAGKDLNVAEESWIRAGGGPKSAGGRLENGRWQMNEADYRAAGGKVDRP